LVDPIAGLMVASTRLMGLLAASVDDRLDEFVSPLSEPPTYEAYRQFSLGIDRYIASDFAAAAPLFIAAHSRDSTFAAPLLFASISLSNQGNYRTADSLLNELSPLRDRLSPFHQAWLDYRRNLLAGQRSAALSAVRALDSASPGTKATYNHAVEALENGYVTEAVSTLRSLTPELGAMRGWIPYYEVLGAAYHILNRFSDELVVGEEARRRYPDRLYAFLPSVRALAALEKFGELDRLLDRAAELSPDPYGTTFARLLLEAADESRAHGNDSRARQLYWRCVANLAKTAAGEMSRGELSLRARAASALGDWGLVEQTARVLLQLNEREPSHHGLLGTALARSGRPSEARSVLALLERDRRPYLFGGPGLAQARIATALGELETAVDYLAQAFAQGREFDLWVHRDSDFDPLRALPRFQALVAVRH
jgi:tetratricopeptide (TPR) repeat protein